LLETAGKLNEKVAKDVSEFETKGKTLLAESETSNTVLNILVVQELSARLRQLMDDITLDELDKTPNAVNDIQATAKELAQIVPLPPVSQPIAKDIKYLVAGLLFYKDASYEDCIAALKNVTDENTDKHRLLGSAYAKLYVRAKKDKKRDDQIRYAALSKSEDQTYFELVKHSNHSVVIALRNLATGLMDRNEQGDVDQALEYLKEAKKREPQRSITYYNMANVFAIKHMFAEALDNLELAKIYGDFSTEKDIADFNGDQFFDELRSTDVPAYKERLSKLLAIQK
jgi:tetratricopeptide (TPR) repeat protein